MVDSIVSLVKKIWKFIKHIICKVVSFFNDIVGFFKDAQRQKKLEEDADLLAVAVKEKLENNKYRVVNALFNKSTGKIEDYQIDAIGIKAEDLDNDTKQSFGNEDMIVLT